MYEHNGKKGLRSAILDFFEYAIKRNYTHIAKVDNDCLVPHNWLKDMMDVFNNTDIDILSPNVKPSNAAYKHGEDTEEFLGYRKAQTVGGLWMMRTELIRDMQFEKHKNLRGLIGAIPLLRQIVNENDPKIGWTTKVTFEDLGHWSGKHPEHIKSNEHKEYSQEVGRQVAW